MTFMPKTIHTVSLCAVLALSACSSVSGWFGEDEAAPLEGERLSLYDFEKTLQQGTNTQFGLDGSEEQTLVTLPKTVIGGTDTEIALSPVWENKFWPQVGGYPNHAMKHVALSGGELSRDWSVSIGHGAKKNIPMTAAPIVADDKVFTLDTNTTVQAVDARTGKRIWSQRVIKKGEDPVIGGGLAFSGGTLFVTNGFNEVLALNPANGDIVWRTLIDGPTRAAPAAVPGRVFVVTMDNKTIALDSTTGKVMWRHIGLTETAGVLGSATPAVTRDSVITAYSSGEIYALRIENGQELWGDNLSPLARAAGRLTLSDIRALPVVFENHVYAVSYANRMAAIDMRTGRPVWQANIGSIATPWVSGNRIFVISTENTLVSMDRMTGQLLWQKPLPQYQKPDSREGAIIWQGPILAGNRLIALSSNGLAQEFNPVDGEIIREWKLDGDVTLAPAVANGTLYTVNSNGRLTAWR